MVPIKAQRSIGVVKRRREQKRSAMHDVFIMLDRDRQRVSCSDNKNFHGRRGISGSWTRMMDYRARGRLSDRLSRDPKREPLSLSRETVHDDTIALIADICLIPEGHESVDR